MIAMDAFHFHDFSADDPGARPNVQSLSKRCDERSRFNRFLGRTAILRVQNDSPATPIATMAGRGRCLSADEASDRRRGSEPPRTLLASRVLVSSASEPVVTGQTAFRESR
jgi:hypothetical protein